MINNLNTNIQRCYQHTAPRDKDKELMSIINQLTHLNRQLALSNHASILKFENCTGEITFMECYNQYIFGTIEDYLAKTLIKIFPLYILYKINKPKSWEVTGAYYEDLIGNVIDVNEFIFHTIRKTTDIKYAVFSDDHIFDVCSRLIYLVKYLHIDGEKIIDLRLKYQRLL